MNAKRPPAGDRGDAHSTRAGISQVILVVGSDTEVFGEVAVRLDAIASNSASALLGQLPVEAVLEANVVLAERAAEMLRAVA